MKIFTIIAIFALFLFLICGCNSISVGGSGQVGGVTGGGAVNIPIPRNFSLPR